MFTPPIKKGQPIPKELKDQILERIKRGETPIARIAQEHGIHTSTIYNWLGRGVTAPPSVAELARLKKENQALTELIGKLTIELENEKKKEAVR